jgi:predicted anti-sigma-YlaC factor YlaD
MSCRWSLEADLAAVARELRERPTSALAAHRRACADCRSALAPWVRLDALVRAAVRRPPGWHPADEALVGLLERPRSQTPAERARLAAHLDACPPCRDALLAVAALP